MMDLGRVDMKMEKPPVPIEKLNYTITGSGNTGKLQNSATQAEVRVFILDNLYQSLPQPPFTDEEIEQVSDRVYNHIWGRSCSQSPAWVS
jgi:hypothetical protein